MRPASLKTITGACAIDPAEKRLKREVAAAVLAFLAGHSGLKTSPRGSKNRARNILRKFGLVLLATLTFARTANVRGGGAAGSTDLTRGAVNPET
jgi:hypothetical protein